MRRFDPFEAIRALYLGADHGILLEGCALGTSKEVLRECPNRGILFVDLILLTTSKAENI